MAHINGSDLVAIRNMMDSYMADGANFSDGKVRTSHDIVTGSDAWTVAHRAGVTAYCYGDTSRDLPGISGCVDAHIKTALATICPNAVFKDNYRY